MKMKCDYHGGCKKRATRDIYFLKKGKSGFVVSCKKHFRSIVDTVAKLHIYLGWSVVGKDDESFPIHLTKLGKAYYKKLDRGPRKTFNSKEEFLEYLKKR